MQEPKIPGGYINIARKIVDSEIWRKPPLYIKVWLYLLTKAQHSQYKSLRRGQLYTSIPEIIEACSWKVGYRKEKPRKDQVYQVIDWLRKNHENDYEEETKATMITTMKATQGLLITIDNYSYYQDAKNYESNRVSHNEEKMKENRKQQEPDNTNNNVKNGNNEKNKILIVNNDNFESVEGIEKEFKDICNDYFTEFSVGRWSKEQWYILIDQYVKEIIAEKRYLDIDKSNRRKYVFNSLKNIAYKHDLKNNANRKSNVKEIVNSNVIFYDWLSGDNNK
ncbi:hypothetical protein [Robertmurraya sp. Marseille-Q9965]